MIKQTFIAPMLAKLTPKAFNSPDYIFEKKYDGYRAIAVISQGKATLYSRNGKKYRDFPEIINSLARQKTMILDGEIIAIVKKGSSFQALQNIANKKVKTAFVAFDILSYEGKKITNLPQIKRKELLKKVLVVDKNLIYSEHIENKGISFFQSALRKNLEGIMAKNKNTPYLPGKRTNYWLKIKNHQADEAIIIGFTRPQGTRKYFGALLLAQYKNHQLQYIGRTGTGFDRQNLKYLYNKMTPLKINKTTANKLPKKIQATWIKPLLVAQIKFTEWTENEILRQPVFMGLREDKAAREVTGEKLVKNP